MEVENKVNSLGLFVSDHVAAMLAYWDKDMVCRYANAAYMDWFGKTPEEIVNKITLKELLGQNYEKNLPYISGVLKGEKQFFERTITLPSGELRFTSANYYPDIVKGEVRGFFVYASDITPIKLLKHELIKSNEMISEQNKRLLNFANVISHNLKNYSNGFTGMIELLSETEHSEDQIEIIKHLKKISNNFNETIKNLNEIVHEKNIDNIELTAINLNEYIIKAISSLSLEIEVSNAIIYNNVDENTIIMGNSAYIESILVNFLSNAIKYKHPDRDPIIELSCVANNEEVILNIADNGKGINLDEHGEEIFEMYKTFHGNNDAQGIGLYITKYHIEVMGGHVQVESEENVGSKFIIHLSTKNSKSQNTGVVTNKLDPWHN